MPDHVEPNSLWLIGAGPMAVAYGHVLASMKFPFTVVGRGAKSAEKFRESVDVPVHAGGVQQRLLHAKRPDMAIVAVNLPELAKTTKMLIEAGTSKILLEKPGALTLAAIQDLDTFATEHGASVFIAYNRRFNASTQAARQIIKADGGVRSFHFEFTEWSHKIEHLPHPDEVLKNWLFANSSHVIDLAFHLGGSPTELHCQHQGSLSWHPTASQFSGAGKTATGALFSYQADWEAPGRWGVEVATSRRRLYLRPLELLSVQEKGSIKILPHVIDDAIDNQYKPGLYAEVQDFLAERPQHLPSLTEHCRFATDVLQPIAGLGIHTHELQQAG